MPTYSVNGYPAAISMRSNRTLLVEGPSDKATVARLIIELRKRNRIMSDNVVIDTGEDLPDATGGNRERVEAMHSRVGGSSKFAALVDREFRGFDLAGVRDLSPGHCVIPVNRFWTRGHSLENYLSEIEIVIAGVEEYFPEHLPSNYRQHLVTAFPSILRNCAGLSLAANAIGKLDRARTISELDHWIVRGDDTVEIDITRLRTILSQRGVSTAEFSAFDLEFQRCLTQLAATDLPLSRWICHGHIAECHIWCAVAAVLRSHGMSNEVATRIGWGKREALVKVSRGVWSEQCVAGVGDHPQDFIHWLCG